VRRADRNSCDYVYISTGVRKPYSCLGGGIVLTDNEKLYEHLKNHTLSRRKPKNKTAQLKRFILTTMFFFGFNPVLYPFTFILRRKTNLLNSFFSETGNDIFTVNPEYFYPMARFQARIGIVQLKKINRLLETRRISGDIYFRLLEPHYDWVKTFLKPGTAYSHMPYLHPERDKLEVFLNNNSIDTERYFDYTIPDIKQYGDDGNYPRSHKIGKQILNLPMNVGLTEKKISYVVQKIIEFDKLNSKNK
jgi:dTDP-4-amino-4,6-dideoxygalactose transaminase